VVSCRRGFFIPNKFSSEGSRQCGPFGFQALRIFSSIIAATPPTEAAADVPSTFVHDLAGR
jgi:hypothetical protein